MKKNEIPAKEPKLVYLVNGEILIKTTYSYHKFLSTDEKSIESSYVRVYLRQQDILGSPFYVQVFDNNLPVSEQPDLYNRLCELQVLLGKL